MEAMCYYTGVVVGGGVLIIAYCLVKAGLMIWRQW